MQPKRHKGLTFQEIIFALHNYWQSQGCLAWHPHHEMVGAGTYNPATILRVLGPEPWNVAYVEPSFRPDDGRFAENPNRMQMHHQYQVILQPPPKEPQEMYLGSLDAIGLDRAQHDIRFVEDNWESPALSAWGLGWEVWLDGMEITQFTYFQQAGGMPLDPPACEITYGLERIAMYLQDVQSVWDLTWDGTLSYGDILKAQEIEFCEYYFNVADIPRMETLFANYEEEAKRCIERKLTSPALDYVLRCSHTFNILDTRGAIGLSERVKYFGRMRDLTKLVAELFAERREAEGFPLCKALPHVTLPTLSTPSDASTKPETFVFELGVEELAAFVPPILITQIRSQLPDLLAEARLSHGAISVQGTPRRIAVVVEQLAPRQTDRTLTVRGPTKDACERNPNALAGFCRKHGVTPDSVQYVGENGTFYATLTLDQPGRSALETLPEVMTTLLRGLKVDSSMRWLASAQYGEHAKQSFNRPVRWLLCLLGDQVVPFLFAGVASGNTTRGGRWEDSPDLEIRHASDYLTTLHRQHIVLDPELRREAIRRQVEAAAHEAGGVARIRDAVLDEVTYLVEYPTAFLCRFDERFVKLPTEVIVSTLEKHTRCFSVFSSSGEVLPLFVGVRNGSREHLEVVQRGYERLTGARFSDAEFFVSRDLERTFEDFNERIKKLVFHAKHGSMYDKSVRLARLVPTLIDGPLPLPVDRACVLRAASFAKADLGSQMVTEMTSLQGEMGRFYALRAGEPERVATALFEQYLPRNPGDRIPETPEGLALSIADRSDTIAALFSAGVNPTGSADPFGLRREAGSILQCLIEAKVYTNLREVFALALQNLSPAGAPALLGPILEFVNRRFEVSLREEGFRHDAIRAVLSRIDADPYLAKRAIYELHAMLVQDDADGAETFKLATQAYLRCARIVAFAEKKGITIPAEVDRAALQDTEEKRLLEELQSIEREVEGLAYDARTPHTLYGAFAKLVPAITAFFDKVLVMAEDPVLRNNRLALVQRIVGVMSHTLALEELEGFRE